MSDGDRNFGEALAREGLTGVICNLPENILALTGYWPSTGDSLLVYPTEGKPCLVIPSVDRPLLDGGSEHEVIEYDIEGEDLLFARTRQKLHALLKELLGSRSVRSGKLGIEKSFETVAGSFRGSEANVPGDPFFRGLEADQPEISWVDASALLKKWRQIKTPAQVQALRRCHAIAAEAFAHGREIIRPGVKEIEIAAAIEARFQEFGTGFEGVRRARGFAFAMSGPVNGANAWLPANFSTDRRVKQGELVLIEFNGYADGYWADLSRTFVVGEPDARQKELAQSMQAILQGVIAEIKPGTAGKSLDLKARSLMKEHGLAAYFPHYIGHGVGLAFHESPILSEGFESVLEAGMVLAIEPGIYLPEYGGIRLEENVLVTDRGSEVLSDFSLDL